MWIGWKYNYNIPITKITLEQIVLIDLTLIILIIILINYFCLNNNENKDECQLLHTKYVGQYK